MYYSIMAINIYIIFYMSNYYADFIRQLTLNSPDFSGVLFDSSLARLDLCISPPVVALPGRIHKARINDLTLLGAIALRDSLLIEVLE